MSRREELFSQIQFEKPSDLIIRQIRDLISSGHLTPGDRLPSERHLAERMGVGRGHVREAIKRLEFYGILRTSPQQGTFVSSLGVRALEGLIANILDLDREDFVSLMDTRCVLEVHAAKLAAQNATEEDVKALTEAHDEFERMVKFGQDGLEEDLVFHLKIAEMSKSSVLRSLLSLITPDVIQISRSMHICESSRTATALDEHRAILAAIESRDSDAAALCMAVHMEQTIELKKKVAQEMRQKNMKS